MNEKNHTICEDSQLHLTAAAGKTFGSDVLPCCKIMCAERRSEKNKRIEDKEKKIDKLHMLGLLRVPVCNLQTIGMPQDELHMSIHGLSPTCLAIQWQQREIIDCVIKQGHR